jgi:hypothetical protein
MYLTSQCTNSRGYFPTNTKWGATSTLSGFFRPNQAMARGFIPGGGLGALEVDPTTLGLGIGALALAAFLFGRKHPRNKRGGRIRRALRELRS